MFNDLIYSVVPGLLVFYPRPDVSPHHAYLAPARTRPRRDSFRSRGKHLAQKHACASCQSTLCSNGVIVQKYSFAVDIGGSLNIRATAIAFFFKLALRRASFGEPEILWVATPMRDLAVGAPASQKPVDTNLAVSRPIRKPDQIRRRCWTKAGDEILRSHDFVQSHGIAQGVDAHMRITVCVDLMAASHYGARQFRISFDSLPTQKERRLCVMALKVLK